MAFKNSFKFAPAEWLPFQDQEVLDSVINEDMYARQGKNFENPDFELKIVFDVHDYFAIDLMQRIRMSDINDEKLVLVLTCPENATFISLTEALNKYNISCRNVHIFFTTEYANQDADVAPWQSPYSRAGKFMKYFYERLKAELRMPMEQIHFWTKENTNTYSDELAKVGGADVVYTSLSWSGGICGTIDPETFPAKTMEEFTKMGSRLVTPMAEAIAYDSLRGMFGFSGDIGNVPPRSVTIGPKDLMAAKEWIDVEFLVGCGGVSHQKHQLRLSLFGPVCPQIPGSLMRLHKGKCYVSPTVAAAINSLPDHEGLIEKIEAIRQKEER